MALELNIAGAVPDAFRLSPRQIFAMWRSYQALRPDLEKRQAVVHRAAGAEQKAFEEWMKGK